MENKNLPKIIELSDFDGNYKKYIDHLYYIVFRKDFIESQPLIFSRKVIVGNQKIIEDKESVFWHITSKDDRSCNERLPDLRRCERLPWIKFFIENHHCLEDLLVWEKKEKNKEISLYLFLKNEDFVVVLRKKKYCYILITAFCILYKRKRKWLLKDYEKAKSVQK